MKKIFILFLASFLLLSGCSKVKMQPTITSYATESFKPATDDIPTFNEYVKSRTEKFENNTREFGERASFLDINENLTTYIVYPKTNEAFLDAAIKNWADKTVSAYKSEKTVQAKLFISYDSFVVDKNTVSIKFQGTYFNSDSGHSSEIIKTFNADISEKKLINIKDITKSTKKLKNMLFKKAKISKKTPSSNKILENFLMTKDGIEIILNDTEYFPETSVTIHFNYSELNKFTPDEQPGDKNEPPTSEKTTKHSKADVQTEAVTVTKTIPTKDISKPKLALTFDDGPSPDTGRLLNIFAQHGGHGTFFVIGNQISDYPETVKRIVNEGHQIGNHTWNHPELSKLSYMKIYDQISLTNSKIYEIAGVYPSLLRPPYGSFNDTVKAVCKDFGLPLINWSVDTLDWKTKNADLVYSEVINNARDGAIILCHDLHKTTVDAMEKAIPELIENGFELVTVSELLGDIEPGKVYRKK